MDLICEEKPSDSPLVELIWRNNTDSEVAFTSVAESHYNIVVSRYEGRTSLTVRGPESKASPAYAPRGAETFGIMFKAGVFIPDWPAARLMDRNDVTLPEASSKTFWLKGAGWQFPTFENADTFINRLVRDGLLVREPLVSDVLSGRLLKDVSLRTAQRRFVQATGLTHGSMRQIDRARFAARLLTQGRSIADTLYEAGYYDQPHLTRCLKTYVGFTPAQLVNPERTTALSFLYKTAPLLLDENVDITLSLDKGQKWNANLARLRSTVERFNADMHR